MDSSLLMAGPAAERSIPVERFRGQSRSRLFRAFLSPGACWHPHPFRLSAEPVLSDSSGRSTLRITVRNLGRGSAQLAGLKRGTRVAVEGPYGLFSIAARNRNRVVLIGAGIGITPIRALLERTPFEPGNATVFLRGHSEEELFCGPSAWARREVREARAAGVREEQIHNERFDW